MRMTPEQDVVYFSVNQSGGSLSDSRSSVPFVFPEELVLLPRSEALKVLERFRETTELLLAAARKDQEYSLSREAVPSYLLFLIVILGFNEFVDVCRFFLFSPLGYMFIFICILGGVVIWQLGFGPLVLGAVRPYFQPLLTQARTQVTNLTGRARAYLHMPASDPTRTPTSTKEKPE